MQLPNIDNVLEHYSYRVALHKLIWPGKVEIEGSKKHGYKRGDEVDQLHHQLCDRAGKVWLDNKQGFRVLINGEQYLYYFHDWCLSIYSIK